MTTKYVILAKSEKDRAILTIKKTDFQKFYLNLIVKIQN